MFDYKLIEALTRVVEEGGFERAARVLCLTQSAVSQRIRQLEDGCGQVLLRRGSPPEPTDAGRRLLRHYRQVRLLEDDLNASLAQDDRDGPATLTIGVNADALATWFLDTVRPLLVEGFVLDLRHDDQEETHRRLREGDVIGCISTEPKASRGCRVVPLGPFYYRLLATPGFQKRWFPDGFTLASAELAPVVNFDRKDRLHLDYCRQVLGSHPTRLPCHYIPSPSRLYWLIEQGFGYGMVPDRHSADARAAGRLIDLVDHGPLRVDLYWHCWNLQSEALLRVTELLETSADPVS